MSLDTLPAWARHALIVVGSVVLTVFSQAIAHRTLNWTDIAWGIAAGLVAHGLLVLTPLTRQYGIGAPPPPGQPVIEGTP